MGDLTSRNNEASGADPLCRLDDLLAEVASDLRAAIDLSLIAVAKDPHARKIVSHMWENMLASFYGYTRQKKRETGTNIMSWVSFSNVIRR